VRFVLLKIVKNMRPKTEIESRTAPQQSLTNNQQGMKISHAAGLPALVEPVILPRIIPIWEPGGSSIGPHKI